MNLLTHEPSPIQPTTLRVELGWVIKNVAQSNPQIDVRVGLKFSSNLTQFNPCSPNLYNDIHLQWKIRSN